MGAEQAPERLPAQVGAAEFEHGARSGAEAGYRILPVQKKDHLHELRPSVLAERHPVVEHDREHGLCNGIHAFPERIAPLAFQGITGQAGIIGLGIFGQQPVKVFKPFFFLIFGHDVRYLG